MDRPSISLALTLYKRTVEPLHIVAVGIQEQHLVAGDGNGQQHGSPFGNGQCECAKPKAVGLGTNNAKRNIYYWECNPSDSAISDTGC